PAREEALSDAILERMEGDDYQPATGLEQPLCGGKTACELIELVVQIKTERLEGTRRRVFGFVALAAEHARDDVRQLFRRLDRRFGAPCHDSFGNCARAAFLAEFADDLCEFSGGEFVDNVARAGPFFAHAHVERPFLHEGEAALRLIELHRGDTEIERDAVDGFDSLPVHDLVHGAKAAGDELQPARELRSKRATCRDRLGIAIDGDDLAFRSFEDGFAVTASAERPVDDDCAGLRLKRVKHLREHHGNVAGPSPDAPPPPRHHPRAPSGPPLPRRPAPSNLRRSRTFCRASAKWASNRPGSHIWNFSPRPTKVMCVVMPACSLSRSGRMVRPS